MRQNKSPIPLKKPTLVYSDFVQAKERILNRIAQGPFYGLLTGESGSGKTSLLREVSSSLDPARYQVHYLAQSCASRAGLGLFLVNRLHLSVHRTHSETLQGMAQALRAYPLRMVLFVDEAHLLSSEALQEARLLSESEIDTPGLFTVLFAGLPELKAKLDQPSLFPLKRRLALRLELGGLKTDEVGPFLLFRLGEAHAARLSPEAHSAIFERARGIPALIEALATRCLEDAPQGAAISLETILETLESWEIQ